MARAHDSIEIYRARDGWRFRVRASNHRIIASGESYTRKRDAIRGATRAHPGLIVRVVGSLLLMLALSSPAAAQQLPAPIQSAMDALKVEILKAITPVPPPPPPPGPVDCVVSPMAPAWTVTSSAAVGVCTNGQQDWLEQLSRVKVSDPVNGGAACPALTGSRTVQKPCTSIPPSTGGLVQPGDWTLAGGYRLPSVTVATSSGNVDGYGYGGHGLALNGSTAFIGGHKTARRGWISEIAIPALKTGAVSGLTTAAIVQPLTNITGGLSGWDLGGLLVWGQRLIVAGYVFYDANNSQVDSHYTTALTFATASVSGPHKVSNALGKAGFVSAFMDEVPAEWQAALGGPYGTGNAGLSIISRTSTGPTLTVFDPSRLTDPAGAPGITVLGYPLAHDTMATMRTDTTTGVAFIDGTPTVAFAGRAGTDQRIGKTVVNGVLLAKFPANGPSQCYGTGITDPTKHGTVRTPGDLNCYDPVYAAKGEHAWPYVPEVKFYDVRDLVKVKAGVWAPWTPVPYAIWHPTFPAGWIGSGGELRGMAYDAVKRQMHLLAYGGDGSKSLPVVFQR